MAYYYRINESEEAMPISKGFHLQKVKKSKISEPKINYDFSKHVLIELLDDTTPESKLWEELGLSDNKNIIHKRMMIDSHRMKCRRAIIICSSSDEATLLAKRLSQTKVRNRCVCAIVVQDLLSDLCLFEKQIIQYGDKRPQHQLLYVSDLSRSRGPSGLVKFLKETFSPFGTILSVLVCSDDDDYAFPEGVIRFAYLSEAFAAELAFDQYIIGRERLSVTTHHNILLSQCDLRARLRGAQYYCNSECVDSNGFTTNSNGQTYELNNLSSFKDDPVVDSMHNLRLSPKGNKVTSDNNLRHNETSDSLPAFSQCNFNQSYPNKQYKKDTSYNVKNTKKDKDENFSYSVQHNIKQKNKIISTQQEQNNNVNSFNDDMEMYNDTFSIDGDSTKVISQVSKSNYSENHTMDSLNLSTISSINTYHVKNSKSKKYKSVASDCKQLSSFHSNDINDTDNHGHIRSTNSKKRRNNNNSQKLSLKSQRTALSQKSIQQTDNSVISDLCSSQQEKTMKMQSPLCEENLNLSDEKLEFTGPAKVTNWLQHLSNAIHENEEYSLKKQEHLFKKEKTSKAAKHSKSRISVFSAPTFKQNRISIAGGDGILFSNVHSSENEDPNKCLGISSEKNNGFHSTDKSLTPLRVWLKEELMSSVTNSVTKSVETSKSMIVCAGRTKDIIISVGCSHMTCDSCYPESTDLLLDAPESKFLSVVTPEDEHPVQTASSVLTT